MEFCKHWYSEKYIKSNFKWSPLSRCHRRTFTSHNNVSCIVYIQSWRTKRTNDMFTRERDPMGQLVIYREKYIPAREKLKCRYNDFNIKKKPEALKYRSNHPITTSSIYRHCPWYQTLTLYFYETDDHGILMYRIVSRIRITMIISIIRIRLPLIKNLDSVLCRLIRIIILTLDLKKYAFNLD